MEHIEHNKIMDSWHRVMDSIGTKVVASVSMSKDGQVQMYHVKELPVKSLANQFRRIADDLDHGKGRTTYLKG